MKCNKCGYDWSNSGDSAHVCGPVKVMQQRTWVGLTDEEKENCLFSKSGLVMDYEDVIDAVEAKLKEKNT